MYTDINFKTKAALKEAFASGKEITTYQPGGFFESKTEGRITIEGPHYPQSHQFYATATIKNGVIVTLDGKTAEQVRYALERAAAKKAAETLPCGLDKGQCDFCGKNQGVRR